MTHLITFYNSLTEIRESFHKYGKFNDSNSKLDELSKLLAIYVNNIKTNKTDKALRSILHHYKENKNYPIVEALSEQFKLVVDSPLFKLTDDVSIFADDAKLLLNPKDKEFAFSLLKLIVEPLSINSGPSFDILNESFGHFVRDNFRNNIEDAQYMTPHEVVTLMCKMALEDLTVKDNDFIVMDPCCGVGSFLTTFNDEKKKNPKLQKQKIKLVGQDKVPRMLRLTKLNLLLDQPYKHELYSGNSLIGNSKIDLYTGKVDLILTNPPFGAKFSKAELTKQNPASYPLLNDCFNTSTNINSEILFIDRCLSLLKDGGELLAVVPDSVISSSGLAAVLRHRIYESPRYQIRSIVELPTVTFAQAGTRTKTSILHIKKAAKKESKSIFIAQSDQIGFEVSSRKGATIKIAKGENDLKSIFDSYQNSKKHRKKASNLILCRNPSALLIETEALSKNSWTPNHFNAARTEIVDKLLLNRKDIDLVPLGSLVQVVTNERRKSKIVDTTKCISVLHIVNGDILDYEELFKYDPIYKGIPVRNNDLIFSKINPRIPRAIVVPDLEIPLSCSTEFEIMQSSCEFSNHVLKALLFLPQVQIQINHLTSGTSSSHNRIKTEGLKSVLLPIPKKHTTAYTRFCEAMKLYEDTTLQFQRLNLERFHSKKTLANILG